MSTQSNNVYCSAKWKCLFLLEKKSVKFS
jgi:hypothetical protein